MRPTHYFTVLPFFALLLAQDAKIHTRIEDDGTGIRKVEIAADRENEKQIKGDVVHLLPDVPGRRLDSAQTADSYRIFGDLRFVRPAKSDLGDMEIVRATKLGGWPPLKTTYEYKDVITQTEHVPDPAHEAAAPLREYTYTVTMPGEIDESSIMPPDGTVDGRTVKWTLNMGSETINVSVSSMEPAWAMIVLIGAVLAVLACWVARYFITRAKNKPRKI